MGVTIYLLTGMILQAGSFCQLHENHSFRNIFRIFFFQDIFMEGIIYDQFPIISFSKIFFSPNFGWVFQDIFHITNLHWFNEVTIRISWGPINPVPDLGSWVYPLWKMGFLMVVDRPQHKWQLQKKIKVKLHLEVSHCLISYDFFSCQHRFFGSDFKKS